MVKMISSMFKMPVIFFFLKSAGPGIRQTWLDFHSHQRLAPDLRQVLYLLFLLECSPKYRDLGISSRKDLIQGTGFLTKPLGELEESQSLPYSSGLLSYLWSVCNCLLLQPEGGSIQEATTDQHRALHAGPVMGGESAGSHSSHFCLRKRMSPGPLFS